MAIQNSYLLLLPALPISFLPGALDRFEKRDAITRERYASTDIQHRAVINWQAASRPTSRFSCLPLSRDPSARYSLCIHDNGTYVKPDTQNSVTILLHY
ncbi:hypothetical protein B0T09DRAFT_339316 [Sordaria sp. MPI-SDFR-AT-0083]|nr:hypothetical protein B0T09DRAFT_339316 [Sordaria sp. MPI-SDFR-AT-0083]